MPSLILKQTHKALSGHRVQCDLPLDGLIDDTGLYGKNPPPPVKPDKAELSSIKPNQAENSGTAPPPDE
jgi:hypothetical protein